MLAYGGARVTRRRHNRHRYRHHRRQSGGRRRQRSGDGAGTDWPPAGGAGPRPAGARRRRSVAAGTIGSTGPAGRTRHPGTGRCRDGAIADRCRSRWPADHTRLLYGDARGRVPNASVARAQSVPSVGETAEFLRWTAGQALDASGYWPRRRWPITPCRAKRSSTMPRPSRLSRCSTGRDGTRPLAPTAV